ncbi:hypothetical protein HD554DRAFT_2024441 [Boletus coccyginus]|nr:hypothetical protein HD554DRAFT_2024441 [Boletus coccyginus]
MSLCSTLALTVLVTMAQAQSLTISNKCFKSIFLYIQTSFSSINNNVNVAASASANMDISSNWDGTINVGTGCNSVDSCTTGGPTWNGVMPFSRAEFNFWAIPGSVIYNISLIYGYNVGMKISSADTSCDGFACTISFGCVSALFLGVLCVC